MDSGPIPPPASRALLPTDRACVFFDGCFTEPKLRHPEGVAVGPDGWIWTGNCDGEILRIAPDGSRIERVASTEGFILGLAFDGNRTLYVCDCRHGAVFRLDLATSRLDMIRPDGMRLPNYPMIDRQFGRLLVSDSCERRIEGPGIWSVDLETYHGKLWYECSLNFANGLAARDGDDAIYVCETHARRITRIPVLANGEAGKAEPFATDLPGLPDGIAFDTEGRMLVGCYEPSRILRLSPDGGQCNVLIEDETAHVLCHPTNIAFDGTSLYTANLGRWHIARVELDVGASPLWSRA